MYIYIYMGYADGACGFISVLVCVASRVLAAAVAAAVAAVAAAAAAVMPFSVLLQPLGRCSATGT